MIKAWVFVGLVGIASCVEDEPQVAEPQPTADLGVEEAKEAEPPQSEEKPPEEAPALAEKEKQKPAAPKDSKEPPKPPPQAKNTPPPVEKKAEPPSESVTLAAKPSPPPPTPEVPAPVIKAPDGSVCPIASVPELARSEVYKNVPFKSGEVSRFNLDFGAIHVGYGVLTVGIPVKHEIVTGFDPKGEPNTSRIWHMKFTGHAYTGDWYKSVYSGNDRVQAFARPWNFSVSKFYLEEKASSLFSSVHRKKHFHFNQAYCEVKSTEEKLIEGKTKNESHVLQQGAVDALSAFFKLRTHDYTKGSLKFMVYSSGKNWLLEAVPMGVETVKTDAGSFKCDKLLMRTYLGEKLEQKGKLRAWVARDHPARPLVKIEGEFKFGDIQLELIKFTPGQ